MPFDSNGTFNRMRVWANDAAASIKIRADYHDTHDQDVANGLSNVITKDGRTQPTANIPMNQKKIIDLAEPSPGTSEAATAKYVDTKKAFNTGIDITGAGPINGMLIFQADSGINGIGWDTADMAWVGKVAETGKWRKRTVLVSGKDGTGGDLLTIDQGGVVTLVNVITHNLSYDGSVWRTNKAGIGTMLTAAGGVLKASSNDTATTSDNQTTTMIDFFSVNQNTMDYIGNNSAVLNLKKKNGTSGYVSRIGGYVGSTARWVMDLGSSEAESGTAYVGSDFLLTAYNNTGASPKSVLHIDRNTMLAQFYGSVYSNLGIFQSNTTTVILAAANGGQVVLRPNGNASTTEQCYIATNGDWHVSAGNTYVDALTTKGSYLGMGFRSKNGTLASAYGDEWINFDYVSSKLYALVNNTNIGYVTVTCDHRIKRDIRLLGSVWDKVKKLQPVIYKPRAFGDLFKDGDEDHWGLVAHKLQETLIPTAATGSFNAKDFIQSPDIMTLFAALTRALQEAMERIERLEAKVQP